METKIDKPRSKGNLIGGIVIAGVIWAFSQSFRKTLADEVVVLFIAFGAGYLFFAIKEKIPIGSKLVSGTISFVIVFVLAAFFIGFFTHLI